MKMCKYCKHWNGGVGEPVCDECDSTFNDKWDGITTEEKEDDSDEIYNCE